jgi:ribosome modulation factor
MTTTPELDIHAKRVREYLCEADGLKSQYEDYRLKAGRELIEAHRRVNAGETDLTWAGWCGQNIKRSNRDIRRLMAMASADDPARAREAEKARNRAAKPKGSRAMSSSLQAHDEGVGAFLRGVREEACPYTDRLRHAAWRKGWSEIQGRTDASPPDAPAPGDVTDPLADLRRGIDKFWRLLSRADQDALVEWLIDQMSEPTSAGRGSHTPLSLHA